MVSLFHNGISSGFEVRAAAFWLQGCTIKPVLKKTGWRYSHGCHLLWCQHTFCLLNWIAGIMCGIFKVGHSASSCGSQRKVLVLKQNINQQWAKEGRRKFYKVSVWVCVCACVCDRVQLCLDWQKSAQQISFKSQRLHRYSHVTKPRVICVCK